MPSFVRAAPQRTEESADVTRRLRLALPAGPVPERRRRPRGPRPPLPPREPDAGAAAALVGPRRSPRGEEEGGQGVPAPARRRRRPLPRRQPRADPDARRPAVLGKGLTRRLPGRPPARSP